MLSQRGAEVSFVAARQAAAERVAAAGYPQDTIRLRGLERRLTPRNLLALVQSALATPRAARILRRRKADVVLGSGSYVVGPVALAARLRRRGLVLMEADSHLGLANRLAAPMANRVTLAFPLPGRRPPRYRVTGRPVGSAVRAATRTGGRRAFGIDPDVTVVLVVGGSQGARTLNEASVEAFGDGPPFELIHVAGPEQVDSVRRQLASRSPGPRYRLFHYLDNLPDAIAAADLVVARSGGSVFELATIGRAAILVPYPYATADHQAKNARWLAEAGAAVVLTDDECSGSTLRDVVGALLADRDRLEVMAAASRAAGRPEAAERVAGAVLAAARRRGPRRGRRLRVPRPRVPRPRRGRAGRRRRVHIPRPRLRRGGAGE